MFEKSGINTLSKSLEEDLMVTQTLTTSKFGEYIKELRKERGLYQSDLATLINKSQTWINFLEQGTLKTMEVTTLVLMSKVLEVPVDDLLINLGLLEQKFGLLNVEPRLAKVLQDYDRKKQLALAKVLIKE
ncbi:MAG: hypothetical protein CMF96_02755 [Candidatus Marinimicrobia bacterium]|nr:hypothetical protein [Candidatus Neomarinimicrobiota bacterium]|tara:strand:- start:240 stop:632 length:393 start_codon:yes stop_codon:yes gene_type:complete